MNKAVPFLLLIYGIFSPAYASEPDAYPFRLTPKGECATILANLLAPQTTLDKGLQALENINFDRTATLSCAGDALSVWQEQYPSIMAEPEPLYSKFNQRQTELSAVIGCFNPWPADSKLYDEFMKSPPQSCKGKFSTAEARDAANEEVKRLTKISQAFRVLEYAYPKSVHAEYDGEIRSAQEKLLHCREDTSTAGSPQFDARQQELLQYCGGKALLPDEQSTVESSLAAAQKQKQDALLSAAPVVAKLQEIFSAGPPDSVFERLDSVFPAVTKFLCTRQSPSSQYWQSVDEKICTAPLEESSALAANRQEMLSALGDLDLLLSQNKAEKARRAALLAENRRRINEPRLQSYEGRRLVLLYQAFVKKGGNPADIAGFCAKNEEEQARDKALTEMHFPVGFRIRPTQINDKVTEKYAGEYGLTEGELGAINAYIGSFYRLINTALYKKEPLSPELSLYRDVLNSALRKMPPYRGTVSRFTQLPEAAQNEHQVGSVINYDSFTSTSRMKGWHWSGNTEFLIYAKNKGKDLSERNDSEQEVLFESGTKFKVLAKEKNGKVLRIVMAEVDEKKEAAKAPASGKGKGKRK